MPVRSFALLITGVILAAGLTVAVAVLLAGTGAMTGGVVMAALLVAAAVVRRAWR